MEILASRVLFRPVDYERSLAFYRDGIGRAVGQTGTVGSARNARHGSRRGDAHLRAGPRGAPATARRQTLTAAVPAAGFEPARSRSRKPALYPLSYAGRRGTPGEDRTPTA